jgi:hypothetical protein
MPNGDNMTMDRWGKPTTPAVNGAKPTNAAAWNNGVGLTFSNGSFGSEKNFFIQVVQHEIGHNWDDENPNWTQFKNLTGWLTPIEYILLGMPSGYKISDDGKWYYPSAAAFVSDYGKTNPYEDFATVFEAYFADYEGRTFIGDYNGGAAGIFNAPAKGQFLDAFLNTL